MWCQRYSIRQIAKHISRLKIYIGTLRGIKLINLSLTNGSLPIGQRRGWVDLQADTQVVDCIIKVLDSGVSNGTQQQQRCHFRRYLRLIDDITQRVDIRKGTLHVNLAQVTLLARKINSMRTRRLIKGIHTVFVWILNLHVVLWLHKSKSVHGLQTYRSLTVLHSSTIVALVLMLHFLLVGHNQLVILIRIDIAALTHLLFRESWLLTISFIQLSFQDTELVKFGLFGITQSAITRGTMLQSEPEVRILLDYLRIVADGRTQVSRLLQQQGTVK